MIGLAIAASAEDARKIVERIVREQDYRLTKPPRITVLETRMGYACVAAREGDIYQRGDRLLACIHYPPRGDLLHSLLDSEDLGRSLSSAECFFSGVVVEPERIALFRDHVGHMPLAYARLGGVFAAALARHPLGSAARLLKPGHILVLEPSGLKLSRWYYPEPWPGDDACRELAERLVEVAERYLPESPCLGFSGGLDSSILAHLAIQAGKRVRGVVVAVEGSLDLEWAAEAASLLDMELEVVKPGDDEILEAADLLEAKLPEAGLMDLSIGSIMLLAARRSRGMLVVGQGADELFGGYWRYERALLEEGLERAAELMGRDLELIHERNLERDELAAALAGAQLLAPYLTKPIYELACSISPELKLRLVDARVVRKWILRRAAEALGVPARILGRPKKAAQYSSGIQKKLRRLLSERRIRGLRSL